MTAPVFAADTHRLIGAGIVGPNAGESIAEAALGVETGADVEDVGMTVHPHPTLSETVGMTAEAFEGSITDLYLPRTKRRPHGAGGVPVCARLPDPRPVDTRP